MPHGFPNNVISRSLRLPLSRFVIRFVDEGYDIAKYFVIICEIKSEWQLRTILVKDFSKMIVNSCVTSIKHFTFQTFISHTSIYEYYFIVGDTTTPCSSYEETTRKDPKGDCVADESSDREADFQWVFRGGRLPISGHSLGMCIIQERDDEEKYNRITIY